MGRPIFSASYSNPAVRTEPEPAPPAIPFAKWTRWNSFDPDSDEFFEDDNAVYEAFLDPADIERRRRRDEPESIGALVEREMERSYSPADTYGSSSDSTVSGRASPMAEGPDDPAGMIADAYRATQPVPRHPIPPRASDPYHWATEVGEISRVVPPPTSTGPSLLDLMNERRVSRNISRSSRQTFIPPHPSTQNDTTPAPPAASLLVETQPVEHATPSPAPAATPRIYTWGPYGTGTLFLESPTPASRHRDSPLTNPSARMSLAHLSPTPMRIRTA